MKSTCYILLLLLSCMFLSCGDKIANPPKNTPDPTKPTQSGRNTVAFKLDGEYYVSQGKTDVLDATGVNYGFVNSNNSYGLYFFVSNSGFDISLFVGDNNSIKDSTYRLARNYPYGSYYKQGSARYNADTNLSNITISRFDSNVIAGTFVFVGKRDSFPDIYITEGWFDIAR